MLIRVTPQYDPANAPEGAARPTVLDTNVVLDWLVFGNPDGAALGRSIVDGALRWVATAAMRGELAHVIARGAFDDRHPDLAALWAAWERHCIALPEPTPTRTTPRCTDPDDQKFIDLAASCAGALLISRDRAVLKLARRLRPFGVEVTTPAAWAAMQAC